MRKPQRVSDFPVWIIVNVKKTEGLKKPSVKFGLG